MKKTITALTIFTALISPLLVLGQTKHRPIETDCWQVAMETKYGPFIQRYNETYNQLGTMPAVILPRLDNHSSKKLLALNLVSESDLFDVSENNQSRYVFKFHVSTRLVFTNSVAIDTYLGIYDYDQDSNAYKLIAKGTGSSTVFIQGYEKASEESLFAAYKAGLDTLKNKFDCASD